MHIINIWKFLKNLMLVHYFLDRSIGFPSRWSDSMQPEKLLLEIPVYEGSPGYPPRYKLPSTDNLSSCPEVSFYIAGKNNSLNFMTKTGLGKMYQTISSKYNYLCMYGTIYNQCSLSAISLDFNCLPYIESSLVRLQSNCAISQIEAIIIGNKKSVRS